MNAGVAAVIVAVLTAVGTVVVGVYTARSARAANRETAHLAGWRDQVESWRKDVEHLRQQRQEDRAAHHAEVVALRNDHAGELANLRSRMDSLERRYAEARTEIRTLTAYARALITLLRQAGIAYPPPPGGLEEA